METMVFVVLIVKIGYASFNSYLLYAILSKGYSSHKQSMHRLSQLLGAIIVCDLICDIGWVISCSCKLGWISNYYLVLAATLYKRLARIVDCTEYFLLTIFLERLVNSTRKTMNAALLAVPYIMLSTALAYMVGAHFFIISLAERPIERTVYEYTHYYVLGTLFYMIIYAIWKSKSSLPKILQAQLRTLAYYLLLPHALLIISAVYNPLALFNNNEVNKYFFILFSDFALVSAIYFCMRRMLKLKFLGIHTYIQRSKEGHFVENNQDILIALSKAKSLETATNLTREIFARAFQITPDHLKLCIRPRRIVMAHDTHNEPATTIPTIEAFWRSAPKELLAELHTMRILIRDELEFDTFYESEPHQQAFLQLLVDHKADLFIPIYEDEYPIGYMLVAQHARPGVLFSGIERAELIVYANHLSATLYFLQHRNLEELIIQEKKLREQLFEKERENQQYRESAHKLLGSPEQRKIGASGYHHRKLAWMNATFRTLLELTDEESPHMHSLKQLGNEALRYNAERSIILINKNGDQICCLAIPHPERAEVLLIARRAQPADTISIPYGDLKDAANWNYSLYLDTTEAGKFIKQVIPGNSPPMINFKIELFKAALSRKATLIEAPQEDTAAIVNILHHLGMRTTIHPLCMTKPEVGQEVAIALFGISKLTHQELDSSLQESLLIKLDATGSLFIENIEQLALDTQERLAHFITTGMFKQLFSDRLVQCNVRVFCSTSAQLPILIEQERFSNKLYAALQQATVTVPSLLSMSHNDLIDLAQTISEQATQYTEFRHLMKLTPRDLNALLKQTPFSLYELKDTIEYMLSAKAQKKHIAPLVNLNRAPSDCPPHIVQAIRLGKRALQDRNTMLLLWNYFQSQAKIAELLGVNRATVHRRLKQYGIGIQHKEADSRS